MAQIRVASPDLVVHLNAVEKLASIRKDVRVPLSAVRAVSVADRPWDSLIPTRVALGFAAGGAPGRGLMTIGPRARTDEGKALLVVYRNARSVVVELDASMTPWALFVVSCRESASVAAEIRRGAGI